MNIEESRRFTFNNIGDASVQLKEIQYSRRRELTGLSDRLSTIVIDYGSENIVSGYDAGEVPELIFRPQVAKNRDQGKGDTQLKTSINTSYDQIDFLKNNYKSPYERNIILHFSLFEQCNDYIFSQLSRPNRRIRNPLLITETLANPIHCRASLLEQLFECYEVDSVMIGVDALFAYFYELGCRISRYETETTLLVNIGATSIHVIPVLRGQVQFNCVQRMNLGANNAFDLFSKSVLLKHSHLKDKLTYSFMRKLFFNFTSVAIDYRLQLDYFQGPFTTPPNKNIYRDKITEGNRYLKEDLTFVSGVEVDFDSVVQIPEEEIKRKEEVRKRMSQKLKDTLNRRKETKRKLHEIELKNYLQLKERYQAHDKFAHEEVVEMFGEHHPLQKLDKRIKGLEVKLGLAEQKGEESKFNLISIPDHELPPEKLKYKKLQIYQKQALQLRKQKQQQKDLEENRMKELRENNPQLYLHQLKETYKHLYTKIKDNQRIRSELSNRKSKLKQRKMQAIARLAEQDFDPDLEQGEDDWLVFKDLEESDHYSELEVMEAELRQIDPEWTQAKDHHHLKETNQLFLLTDLVKCHQIYFQPLLIGLNQIDLIAVLVQTLQHYSPSDANDLRKNVLLVGGGSQISGLQQRISRDLGRESPTGSEIKVTKGKGGALGAFLGMQYIAKYEKQSLDRFSFKREDYLAKGGNLFVSNPWSNPQPNVP